MARINYDKLTFDELRTLREKIETDPTSRSKIGPFFYLSRAVERLNEINRRIASWPKERGSEAPRHDGPQYQPCIVQCPPITSSPATVSCKAVPVPIVPDPRDARIAELEAEVARLEALIVEADNVHAPLSVTKEAHRIRSSKP